jgi:hypothetical protein
MSLIIQAARQKFDAASSFNFNRDERKFLNRKNSATAINRSDLMSEITLAELNSNNNNTARNKRYNSQDSIRNKNLYTNLSDSARRLATANGCDVNDNKIKNNNAQASECDADKVARKTTTMSATNGETGGRGGKKSLSTSICTKLIKLMFSNVGLVLVVFLYSTFGALMFQLLEQHEELRLCEGYRQILFLSHFLIQFTLF